MEAISTALACAAFLAMATLAAVRGRREPLAARFALLSILLFAYNAFDLVGEVAPSIAWKSLESAAASLTPPSFFHFVVTFVGERHERRHWTLGYYVYFGALAALSLSAIVDASLEQLPGGRLWSALMLLGMAPAVVMGAVLLVRHARRSGAEERARAALALGAVLVAACGTATDLAAIASAANSRISSWALVASAALLATVGIRSRLLEKVSVLVALNAAAIATAVVIGEIALVEWVGRRSALVGVGSVLIALAALLAGRFLLGAAAEHRERMRAHATLGRMSKQMAHDLRNPLAAVRGAAQFLQAERTAGRSLDGQAAFVDLIAEQTERMARVIDDYERIGRVEPRFRSIEINRIVQDAMGRTAHALKQLDPRLPRCEADPELLTIAIENVLRNAEEAIGDREGQIAIVTRGEGEVVTIEITDDGPGMDARTRERVFDDFFTTKSSGSGLGLSFVRRVLEAHRGSVAVDSTEGRGTRVVFRIPVTR